MQRHKGALKGVQLQCLQLSESVLILTRAAAAAAPEEVTSQPCLARVVVSELEEALANGRAAFVDDVRRHLRVAKPCRKLRPGLLRN